MTEQQLQKGRELTSSIVSIKDELKAIDRIQKSKKSYYLNIDDNGKRVKIPYDIEEYILGMIEVSYQKMLKKNEKEFENL